MNNSSCKHVIIYPFSYEVSNIIELSSKLRISYTFSLIVPRDSILIGDTLKVEDKTQSYMILSEDDFVNELDKADEVWFMETSFIISDEVYLHYIETVHKTNTSIRLLGEFSETIIAYLNKGKNSSDKTSFKNKYHYSGSDTIDIPVIGLFSFGEKVNDIGCIFRQHPDTDSGSIRTPYRKYPDTISETSGHHIGNIRTPYRKHPDTLSA